MVSVLGQRQQLLSATRHESIHGGSASAVLASDGRRKQLLPLSLLASLLILFISNLAFGESSKNVGAYTIHYIAVNTTFLTPEIAAQYHIKRSKRGAFVNIAVLRNDKATGTPVSAKLSGNVRNLLQQSKAISFQPIQEDKAIYYIGEFEFSSGENLHLKVDVQPEGKGETFSIEWDTQLYAD